ncbi:MAG: ATP-binding protein [Verrucomicrobiota bacterium]
MITFAHELVIVAILVAAGFGLLVFFNNTRRVINQQFLTVSLIIVGWMTCVLFVLLADSEMASEFWLRQAFVMAALIPTGFNLLRLAIKHPQESWWDDVVRSRWFIGISLLAGAMCQTPFFIKGVVLPLPGSPPGAVVEPTYGLGFSVFNAYYVLAVGFLMLAVTRNARMTRGLQQLEFQFVFLGCFVGVLTGMTLALVLPAIVGTSQLAPYEAIGPILMNAIIAYGIATRRILEVAEFLRRATAYALLTTYLVLLYGGVWFLSHLALINAVGVVSSFPHLLAALAVAFSMAPAHGHLQRFANRLFINVQPLDVGSAMQKANRILHSISTLDELLQQFAQSIADAVGTDRVTILLLEKDRYEQKYPVLAEEPRTAIAGADPLAEILKRSREPAVADSIPRLRPSTVLTEAGKRLGELHAAIAVGIHSKRGLDGIMLLGPRLSGRIYSATEQDTLQILCSQLAVALENAKLYTQVQDGKIYNDILLDNLVSGVVAANADGLITVFNREAQRITRLTTESVLNHPMNVLPPPLARALELTFERAYGLRDQEMVVHHGPGDETPIRVGSSAFRGHAGKVLGALLVFNDVTTIKKLELQVRRTDRLASLGTLAAGMAHEIKNPLVTIKTFTQLLPERYSDSDFRDTFSSLIGQEVKRIDSIVNQLLKFSRPAKPNLIATHLHEVLDNSLNLISQQLRQKGITLVCSYAAPRDVVLADADQLNQAFINFFLNSIESMNGNGNLSVTTDLVRSDLYSPNLWRERNGGGHIRVSIRDTGQGIQPEHMPRIFDPFFTTKSQGTGLGLSVAHGIIQEHGGVIDVESEWAKGTTIYVVFPTVGKEASP